MGSEETRAAVRGRSPSTSRGLVERTALALFASRGFEQTALIDALARAAVASNRYPAEQLPELRTRMTLITTVPALQAHSALRYADWRAVVAEYVAARRRERPEDLVPQTVAFAALGASVAAFSVWVASGGDLERLLRDAYAALAAGFRA